MSGYESSPPPPPQPPPPPPPPPPPLFGGSSSISSKGKRPAVLAPFPSPSLRLSPSSRLIRTTSTLNVPPSQGPKAKLASSSSRSSKGKKPAVLKPSPSCSLRFSPSSRLIRTSSTLNVPSSQGPKASVACVLSKVASESPIRRSQSGSGSGPSLPITAPLLPGYQRTLSSTSAQNESQAQNTNLRRYYWLKLTGATEGSLWTEVSKAPELDITEIENVFATTSPFADQKRNGWNLRNAAAPKVEKIRMIEKRRAYNCEIMLTRIKRRVSNHCLKKSILLLGDSVLEVDQVENLVKHFPTEDEMRLLKDYKGDKENLGNVEQFFLELMEVPRVEARLRVWLFKMQFGSKVSYLQKSLNLVNIATEEIRSSDKLKCIIQTILSLGNALNQGTTRGSAIGFQLASLLKLTDTRAQNSNVNLMHYLCKVIAEKLPELLEFPRDLASLEAATKIQLNYLEEEIQAMSKDLEKVVLELSAAQNDANVSETFSKTLKEFPNYAESEVKNLILLNSKVVRDASALILYFGEETKRCPFEQVLSILLNFTKMFTRSHLENCKQHEIEEKNALLDAAKKKRMVNSSRKLSQPPFR